MNDGKDYEQIIKTILSNSGVDFKTQQKYSTSLGNYMADFVLKDGTIIEATKADINKCEKHPFISRKILKLNELVSLSEKLIIVTPFIDSWNKVVNCLCMNEIDFKIFLENSEKKCIFY